MIKLKDIIANYLKKGFIKIFFIEYFLFLLVLLVFSYYSGRDSLKNITNLYNKVALNKNIKISSNIKIININQNGYKDWSTNRDINKSQKFKIIIDKDFSIKLMHIDYSKKIIIIKDYPFNKILFFLLLPLILSIIFLFFLNFIVNKHFLKKIDEIIKKGTKEIINSIDNFFSGTKYSSSDDKKTINEVYMISKEIEKYSSKINENISYNLESKMFWKSILDYINYPIFLINKESIITYINKPAKELIGDRSFKKISIYSVEAFKDLRENIYNSINSMKKFVLNNVKIILPNKKEKIFDISFIPFGGKKQISFALIGKDISEYQNYKINFENLSEIEDRSIIILKNYKKIIFTNSYFNNTFKLSREKINKTDFSEFLDTKEKDKLLSLLKSKKRGEIDCFMKTGEGKQIQVKINFISFEITDNKTSVLMIEEIGKKRLIQKEISFYKIMSYILVKLMDLSNKKTTLVNVLREIGEYLNFDKIIIIDLDTRTNSLSLFDEININRANIPPENIETKITVNTKIDKVPPLQFSLNGYYFFDNKNSPGKIIKYLKYKKIRSMISVPINLGNKKFRFLIFENFSQTLFFNEEEKRTIINIINILSDYYKIQNLNRLVKFNINKYLSVFNNIDFPVYLIDTDTYEILYYNEKMKQLLKGKNIEQERCFELIYKKKSICNHCLLKNKSNDGIVIELNENFYLLSQKLLNLSENKSFLLVAMINITEKTIYEKKIQISQKLELLGQFAGGFIHDINNILAGISGNVEMLELSKDEEKQKKYIERTKKIITKATELAQHVLNFSREKEEKREIIFLDKVLDDAIGIASPSISKKIKIEKDLDKTINIEGKENQLLQVFLNLLTNARDALDNKDSDGFINIKLNKKTIGPTEAKKHEVKAGAYAEVEIKDNGMGMDRKTIAKIFEPFFTTKEKDNKKGTGIGLSTALKIIKEHNGFITVKSRKGEGTSFYIYLPIHKKSRAIEKEKEQKMIPKEIKERFKGVLLLVEDDDILREATYDILDFMGFDVLNVSTAEEGKELLKKNKIDILLLDMQLKENSAEIILKYLSRKKEKLKKVIILTSFTDEELAVKLKKYCSPIIMKKPFSIYLLAQYLEDFKK